MLKPVPAAPAASVWPAILQVVAGVMLFSTSDTMAKYLGRTLPATEIAFLRYTVFVAFGVVLVRRRRWIGVWPKRPRLQVLRGVTILGSAVLFIIGLGHLQMAEAAALSFVSPAFITALSVLLLGEQVGVHRWAATLAGLIGVLIVVRPGSEALQLAALFPLGSAACWAVAMIATRLIGAQDRGETTMLWTAGVGLLLLTMALPFDFVVPRWAEVGLGLCLGVTASSGQFLLILAYRRATASVLAPFSYIQLISSAALGYVVFGSVPDPSAFLGVAIIIASGLYIVHRERVRARTEGSAPSAEAS